MPYTVLASSALSMWRALESYGVDSINEITYLLGFSEPSNVSRAFKRWTGQSPSAYRAASPGFAS